MESVMIFLSENYLYFFLAAIILCFALIGFLIDSKRKKNSEFKGESIVETNTPSVEAPVEAPAVQTVQNEPAEMVTPTEVVMEPTNLETAPQTLGEVAVDNSLDNTMEINDIPINETPSNGPLIGETISYTPEEFEIEELSLDEVPELNSNSELEDLNGNEN